MNRRIAKEAYTSLLTEDLLFNPRSGMPYPKTASEYHALMDQILDAQGRFPGDLAALTDIGTFSPRMHGARSPCGEKV